MPNAQTGFTLLEILTVLVIISLISLFAYPSYRTYIYQSQRSDAMNSLFHYQAQWQQCMIHLQAADACLSAIHLAPGMTLPSLQQHYQLQAQQYGETVTFHAKPTGAQMRDETCSEFLLDSRGIMSAYNQGGETRTEICW